MSKGPKLLEQNNLMNIFLIQIASDWVNDLQSQFLVLVSLSLAYLLAWEISLFNSLV